MAGQEHKILGRQKELQREIRRLSRTMGVLALNHFKGSFRKQGFVDKGLSNWTRRKGNTDVGRAILHKTGKLKNSIRVVRKTLKSVTIGSDLKYAAVHNYGLRAGRGRGFKMPKRQFVGDSKKLERKITKELEKRVTRIFNELRR